MDPSHNPLESPNLRRLIAKFLILASLASSFVLILETRESRRQSSGTAIIANNAASNDIPTSAFTENVPDNAANFYKENLSTSAFDGDYDPKNLTDNLTYAVAAQMVVANPEGPQAGADGSFSFAKPDPDKIVSDYLATNKNNVLLEPHIDDAKIKVSKQYTQQDVLLFMETGQSILEDGFGKDGSTVTNLLSQPPSREVVGALNFIYAEMEAKLYTLSVPAPFLDAHKALLAMIITQKDTYNIDGPDPMKTLLLASNGLRILRAQNAAWQTELEKIDMVDILGKVTGESNRGITSLFIDKAHAAWPVIDIPHSAIGSGNWLNNIINQISNTGDWLQAILEWVYKLLTEVVKDVLINQLAQAVIDWVLGGGKTKFVVNWKGLLRDVGNKAAGGVIEQIAPQLCSGLGPVIKLSTQTQGGFNLSSALGYYQSATRCTLDQVVANIQNFYNDFTQGGWEGYAQIVLPQNNYFGQMMLASDFAKIEAGAKAHATNEESTAGQGFLNPKTCVDTRTFQTTQPGQYAGDPNFVSEVYDPTTTTYDVTLCNSDGFRTNTPGSLTADTLSAAAGSNASIERIVNAMDFTAIVSAILTYAVNKLLASSDGLATYNQTQSPVSATDQCATLYPNTQSQEYANCIANANQVGQTVGNNNSIRTTYLADAQQILDSNVGPTNPPGQSILENTQSMIDPIVGSAVITLQIYALIAASPNTTASCTVAKANAAAQTPQTQADLATATTQNTNAQNVGATLPGVITQMQNSSSTNPAFYAALLAPYGTVAAATSLQVQTLGNAQFYLNRANDAQTLWGQCP